MSVVTLPVTPAWPASCPMNATCSSIMQLSWHKSAGKTPRISTRYADPLPLANRKAKRLSWVLRRQEALVGRGVPRGAGPWVEPLIFLSAIRQRPAIDPGRISGWYCAETRELPTTRE